ncbi:FMN-binding negative transcriptional regulator [Massilia cavernae]|uniref:FMN-binding negative transcriptional regulator n=1 Tax=Massilia cavernae TaxID=2320864 RepID=A0A418XFU0_9BURK|nr:FMN-binding negative transcriptional regulator [Massilia cavernae]RJG11318.1 FMN-binding negative transcriptional regulator [Massilia cavernae]
MYVPAKYEQADTGALHSLIAANPLGTLVTGGTGGLDANHIPFEISPPTPGAPLGVLRAHVARANPVWRRDGEQVMAVFHEPTGYISPSRFEEKERSGRVVPTWDYAVAHAHGTLRAVDDAQWLAALLERLTTRHEAAQPRPWAIADAPPDYIDKLMKAIVGIEIRIERMQGKRKASSGLMGA